MQCPVRLITATDHTMDEEGDAILPTTEAFKAGNDGEYFKCYREGQFARTQATNTMTNEVLTFIELDANIYRRLMVAHTSNDKKKQMELHLVES